MGQPTETGTYRSTLSVTPSKQDTSLDDEHDYGRPGEVDETSTIGTEHSNNHGARVNSNYIRNTNIKIGI